jgi:hypothetical protein
VHEVHKEYSQLKIPRYPNGYLEKMGLFGKKCKFALCAKITALHIQLAFEGKGVGVK